MKIDNGGNSFFVFVKIYLCNKFLFNELVFYFFVNGNSAYFMNVGQNFGNKSFSLGSGKSQGVGFASK